MNNEQFTIFDFIVLESEKTNKKPEQIKKANEEEIVPFNVEDKVMIDWEAVKVKNDMETYYYLRDFKDKRGFVIEVIEKPKLQYKIHFGNGIAYV